MYTSLILAQIIGLFFLIMSVLLAIKPDNIRQGIFKISHEPFGAFVMSQFSLLIGIIIVIFHNYWAMDWRVLITCIGYLSILRGVLLILCPQAIVNTMQSLLSGKGVYVASLIIFILGGVIFYEGICSANWALIK